MNPFVVLHKSPTWALVILTLIAFAPFVGNPGFAFDRVVLGLLMIWIGVGVWATNNGPVFKVMASTFIAGLGLWAIYMGISIL
mgnify:CR=1 FL=1